VDLPVTARNGDGGRHIRHTDTPIRPPIVGGTGHYIGVTGQLQELREDQDRQVSARVAGKRDAATVVVQAA
jgi:hypothetical protein